MAYLRGTTTPPVPPPSFEATRFRRVQHILHGWDGSRWDITDGRNGVYLMPAAVEGLGMPPIENYTFDSPVVHGVEWQGWRAEERPVHWVIGIFEDSSEDWVVMQRQFWNIFRPGKVVVWEMILPYGNPQRLTLTVRFKGDDTSLYSRDPVNLGWAIYGITCFAEQPFWEGDEVSQTWYPGTDSDFFNVTGGPPFNVASFSHIETATLSNLGDVEAFVRWELTGPFTSAAVGLNGLTTTVTDGLAGDLFVINTDPTLLTATKNGVDIMSSLGAFDFEPVPPGRDIQLSLAMNGTGSISAFFKPRYLRAI